LSESIAFWDCIQIFLHEIQIQNADFFENYIRTVFLPHLAITRIMQSIPEETAVRLMDNCSLHLTPVVIDLLSTARVRIVPFAPHTTQIVQVLDLDFALFGVLKRRGQYQMPFGDDRRTARFIKKVYHDFRSTMTDINIWGHFEGLGSCIPSSMWFSASHLTK
jgi:hypothetical protein